MTGETKRDAPNTAALPDSIASSTFRLFGVDVHCHVLSTGQRVIEADSMRALMRAMESGADAGQVDAFAQWQRTPQGET